MNRRVAQEERVARRVSADGEDGFVFNAGRTFLLSVFVGMGVAIGYLIVHKVRAK